MKNKFEFYKENYFKELDKRNEINNSLSLPIGLITAIVAGIFYLLTNFDYKYSLSLTLIFSSTILISLCFLTISVYHLIKAYSDFPKAYYYSILPDTNEIDNYYQELKKFYSSNTGVTDISEQEVENYILNEMIKNTGKNQKNNKRKSKFRYDCEYYLIATLISICLVLPFFGVNYAYKPNNKEPIEVKIIYPQNVNLNSEENRNFVIGLLKDSFFMPTNTITQPKPTPPPSQVIKEGQ